MSIQFGHVTAKMGQGPFGGKLVKASICMVPQDTHIEVMDVNGSSEETALDTASVFEVDILNRSVKITERFMVSLDEYRSLVQQGHNVRILGEFISKDSAVAAVERYSSGELLYAHFESEGLKIHYDRDANMASYVVLNYEPTINLTKLVVTASALKPGTGWLEVAVGFYPVVDSTIEAR